MSHTLAQVKAFPIGTVIPSVTATLDKVFPPKTGEGQYGPWKLQGFVLTDGGEKIKGTLFDADDITWLQGKTVTIIASGTNGKTKKKQGVELTANRQDQSPELTVKGKLGGIITGDGPNPAYLRSSAPASASASAPSSPATPQSASSQGAGSGEQAVEALNRLVSFWVVCWTKAGMFNLPNEARQSMTASLFIEGNKQGIAARWPITEHKPAAKPAAAPAMDAPAADGSDEIPF